MIGDGKGLERVERTEVYNSGILSVDLFFVFCFFEHAGRWRG